MPPFSFSLSIFDVWIVVIVASVPRCLFVLSQTGFPAQFDRKCCSVRLRTSRSDDSRGLRNHGKLGDVGIRNKKVVIKVEVVTRYPIWVDVLYCTVLGAWSVGAGATNAPKAVK